jgi:hypothetical protein
MRTTTTQRNREIFAGFQAGETVNQLAEGHGLAPATVASILNAEKHKLAVSIDEFYLGLRSSPEPQPKLAPPLGCCGDGTDVAI